MLKVTFKPKENYNRGALRKRRLFTQFLRWIFISLLVLLVAILLYLSAVFLLPFIPVNAAFVPATNEPVEVYLLTNGVHTDVVLPMKNTETDWSDFVSSTDAKAPSSNAQFVAFGWGDKGFYLNTPEWSDLTFETAFRAMFFMSTTAMHVTFYDAMNEGASCRKIKISKDQYRKLVKYVEASFEQTNAGKARLIQNAFYENKDAFYEATGTYNLFFTCNSWANKALKTAGMKACFWEALDSGLFRLYPEKE